MLDAAHSLVPDMADPVLSQDVALASRFAPTPSGCRQGPHWFVLATYPKAERRAHAALHLKGFEAYCPWITVRLPNRHYHTHALFPGYLFVRLDLSRSWHPVRYAPGVFELLAIQGVPTPCPETVIDALRAGEALRSIPTPPEALYSPGAPIVAALGGGLKVEGVVVSVDRGKAVIASLMFGHIRTISVTLDRLSARDDG